MNGLGRRLDPSSDPPRIPSRDGSPLGKAGPGTCSGQGATPSLRQKHLGGLGGRPLSLVIRVCTPGHNAPNFPQPHLQEETGSPEDWLVLAALRLGGVDSGFHAVIVVGLGSLVGREA